VRFAQLRHFTYSTTVFHLINAIRKITHIQTMARYEASGGAADGKGDGVWLYRGVRGKLPASFFVPDVQVKYVAIFTHQ
jgi:hypothetical protein